MIVRPKNVELTFNNDLMLLKVNGDLYQVSLSKASSRLSKASDMEKSLYKLSPSGYGIHWPLIDEDLSIEYLIKIAD
ncbi:MAG: DUF2442 domain-containing protein [Bacteroidia bacterium]